MKQINGIRSVTLICGLGLSTSVLADNAINAAIGTTGLVAEYDRALSDTIHVRGSLHYFQIDDEFEEEDINYEGDISSTHFGAIMDYHPFANGFRLSAGIFATDLGIELSAKPSQTEFEIGDNTYVVDDDNDDPLQLSADIDFAPMSPYLGLGWGNSPGAGLGFSVDIGVLFIGEAELDFDASGTVTDVENGLTVNVAQYAPFQEDLQKEQADLEAEFEDFSIYPVIMLGLSYTF